MRSGRSSLFLLGLLGACSSSGGAAVDASDAGALDASDGGAPFDAAADAASGPDARSDTVTCVPACGTGQFCGAGSGTCVSAVVALSLGKGHTCAVHQDGRVSCWGAGAFIGPGLPEVTGPVTIQLPARAAGVAVGVQAACAVLEGGAVSCWGQLATEPEAPRAIVKEDGTPLTGITEVAGGSLTFCGLRADGTYCWGDNSEGELARAASMSFPPDTAVLSHPGPGKHLAATVAMMVHDGASQLCGWGDNDTGLVPGDRSVLESPSCSSALPDVLQISAGDGHVCARHTGKSFSCWGTNAGGQLGIGDETLDVDLPGKPHELPEEIRSLVSGAYHTCALLASGSVMCWGANTQGESGVASPSAPLFAPTPATLVDVKLVEIASGAASIHNCGILADGSVRCWGSDDQGQLGSAPHSADSSRHSDRPIPVMF
jgi:alpha-tubulin suppressor-like RCC1 family protein